VVITQTDIRYGDTICINCGLIFEERIVDQTAEYRLFAGDEKSNQRKRVDGYFSDFLPYHQIGTSGYKQHLYRDEHEFLWEGMRNINDALRRIFPDVPNKSVEMMTKELFQKAFHSQVLQKKGIDTKINGQLQSNIQKPTQMAAPRKKYSRRKQFVVTCLWWSLVKNNISSWNITDLSELVEGKVVSRYSVKHCLRDLGLH